jgi:hypothetical protein
MAIEVDSALTAGKKIKNNRATGFVVMVRSCHTKHISIEEGSDGCIEASIEYRA